VGPTGGYLLAFPLAAGVVGALTSRHAGVLRVLLACALGMGALSAAALALVTTALAWIG